ncbi:MAG TPA: manganese efflux pump [Acidimicrobiia bacterium]
MLGLLLAAAGLGASNAAAAIGIGLGGIDRRTRVRVAVVFGIFEAGMPIVGLVVGRHVASLVGGPAQQLGGALLVLVGVWGLVQARHPASPDADDGPALPRLVLTGLVLSLDNLVVGFALGSLHVSFAAAAVTIGAVSVAMTLVGLEIGQRVGARLGRRGELVGAVVLISLGVLLAAGLV